MSGSESSSTGNSQDEAPAPDPVGGQGAAPPGIVPGSFFLTIFLTIHLSVVEIVHSLRQIPIPSMRSYLYFMVSVNVMHQMTDDGFENDPVFEEFVGQVPQALHGAIENLASALQEIGEGQPRTQVYALVMRVIVDLAFRD